MTGILSFGAPLLRHAVLVMTGASFIYLVLATFQSHRDEEMQYSQLIRTTPWVAWQLEREYFRFREILGDYGEGVDGVEHDDLMLRFDILLSRIPPVMTGSESNLLRNFTGAVDFVPDFEASLLALEDAITTLASGDRAGVRAIIGRLSEYGESLQMLSSRSVLGPEIGRVRENLAAAQARTQSLNFALALTAITLVALLVFELMTSRNLMKRERAARCEARRMAEENERIGKRLESITQAVGVALYSGRQVVGRQQIAYASANFADVAGRSPDFLETPRAIVAAAHQGDREHVERALRRLSTHGRMSVEYRLDQADGRKAWVSHVAVLTDSADGGTETLGIIKDITDQRMANAVMEQNAKLITLGELATGLAHEINQPLSVIRMAAQNTLRTMELRPDADHRDYAEQKLRRIAEQTKRASRIVEQMRIFGRANPEEDGDDFCVNDAVATALDLTGQQLRLSGITVALDLEDGSPRVSGVQQKLEQVLMNIVLNARDAIMERRAREADFAGEIRLSARTDPSGDTCTLAISDDAGGIPNDVLDRLFEPFFTTKNVGKGTGLGLWIAFGFVTRMGGTIRAENVGGGARFSITLPTCAPASPASRMQQEGSPIHAS